MSQFVREAGRVDDISKRQFFDSCFIHAAPIYRGFSVSQFVLSGWKSLSCQPQAALQALGYSYANLLPPVSSVHHCQVGKNGHGFFTSKTEITSVQFPERRSHCRLSNSSLTPNFADVSAALRDFKTHELEDRKPFLSIQKSRWRSKIIAYKLTRRG